eukprot:TRINITY_DN6029_c2_g1_i3.p2 TRINITY_DN6029_c2_g1~~TRINITY_DN6029_c2_g1_i3.p2  ORF type:complete len:133 (+),score=29.05 TRINITY_DN6029_c2_g1_i3:100-498(+)
MSKRVFQISRLPQAVLQAFFYVVLSATWLYGFGLFWTYMVIELPKDLGPYSQMNSLSMFLHRAFPMRETNDTAWEYKFDHILLLALAIAAIMMNWHPTRLETKEAADKAYASSIKKSKAKKLSKAMENAAVK